MKFFNVEKFSTIVMFAKCSKSDSEKGATIVEFSIVVVFWLFIIFMGFDTLFLGYKALSLQYTANTVMRRAIVGPPPGSLPSYVHVDAMEQLAKDVARPFGFKLQDSQIQICPQKDVNCSSNSTGSGSEFIVIRILDSPRFLFMKGYDLRALAVGRNEAY